MPKFINLEGEFYNVAEIAAVYWDEDGKDSKWQVELRNGDTISLTQAQYDTLARHLRSFN